MIPILIFIQTYGFTFDEKDLYNTKSQDLAIILRSSKLRKPKEVWKQKENALTIYISDIEAVDTRYTKQWKDYPPKQLKRATNSMFKL